MLTGAPSVLHSAAGIFQADWGMLVDSETYPCFKAIYEWLNRLVIG